MINAEELKEIYKNGAIVYGVYREYDDYGHYDNIIEEQDLSDGYYIDVYEKYGITGILDDLKNTYDNLFKTKSEAEFCAKYKNIERTETLDLPTWEEFIILKNPFEFYKDRKYYNIYLETFDSKNTYITIQNNCLLGKESILFFERDTTENYLKACELCKKLFMGEEV